MLAHLLKIIIITNNLESSVFMYVRFWAVRICNTLALDVPS